MPAAHGELLKFNKHNYPGVDSIILVCNPYVGDVSNTANVQLYNLTDNVPIAGSSLTANNLYSAKFIQTANLYNNLPDYDITLGVSLFSSIEGKFAATGTCYLFLFRK
jgi:hypothetical protein